MEKGYIYKMQDNVTEQGETLSQKDIQQNSDEKRELLSRINNEYRMYINNIANKNPHEIINNAHEIFIISNIVNIIETEKFNKEDIKALLTLENPLDSIYKDWQRVNFTMIDAIMCSIETTIEQQKDEPYNHQHDFQDTEEYIDDEEYER